MKEQQELTEKWLRSKYLILKKSDRENPKLVFVYDVIPLHIEDKKFWFYWGETIEQKTHIRYVSDLKLLYKALTFEEFPKDSFGGVEI